MRQKLQQNSLLYAILQNCCEVNFPLCPDDSFVLPSNTFSSIACYASTTYNIPYKVLTAVLLRARLFYDPLDNYLYSIVYKLLLQYCCWLYITMMQF